MVVVAGAGAVVIRLIVGAVLAADVATARQIPYKLQAPAIAEVSGHTTDVAGCNAALTVLNVNNKLYRHCGGQAMYDNAWAVDRPNIELSTHCKS